VCDDKQGILEDGQVIMVKKISKNAPIEHDQVFTNEVQTLTTLKHENAVQLVGFCRETYKEVAEKNGGYITTDTIGSLLCYEYLSEGSLEKNLFGMQNTIQYSLYLKIGYL
jgi:hypothetical protein